MLSGDIKRREALEKAHLENCIGRELFHEDGQLTVKKLGLMETEFAEIVVLRVKTKYDYDRDSLMLERIPKVFTSFNSLVALV